jgi:hypothetical protein
MISEARLSAILVAAAAGVGLTLVLANAFRDILFALYISVPVALVMGAVMALFASDQVKKRDDKSPKGE